MIRSPVTCKFVAFCMQKKHVFYDKYVSHAPRAEGVHITVTTRDRGGGFKVA